MSDETNSYFCGSKWAKNISSLLWESKHLTKFSVQLENSFNAGSKILLYAAIANQRIARVTKTDLNHLFFSASGTRHLEVKHNLPLVWLQSLQPDIFSEPVLKQFSEMPTCLVRPFLGTTVGPSLRAPPLLCLWWIYHKWQRITSTGFSRNC